MKSHLIVLLVLAVLCACIAPSYAQFSPSVNQQWIGAMQNCGGTPCTTVTIVAAAPTPLTGTNSLNDLLRASFQNCAGTPCLTVSAASGGGTGTVTHTAGALTANQLVIGNGGADIQVLGTLGTTTTVLHGNAAGAPTFGAVVLTTDVSGILPYANGGTNASTTWTQGSVIFAGASSFSQDNANFFWDATNHRLGIGNTAPAVPLHMKADGALVSGTMRQPVAFQNAAATAGIAFNVDPTGPLGIVTCTNASCGVVLQTAATQRLLLNTSGVLVFGGGEGSGTLTGGTVRGPAADGVTSNVPGVDTILESALGSGTGAIATLSLYAASVAQASGALVHIPVQHLQIGSGLVKLNFPALMVKTTALGTAPGAANARLEVVCGTGAGTAKLIMSAGTSATAVTVIDNVGAGVTGC